MVSTACSVALTAVDVLLGDRGKRQAICSLRSTAGSPKASIRSI